MSNVVKKFADCSLWYSCETLKITLITLSSVKQMLNYIYIYLTEYVYISFTLLDPRRQVEKILWNCLCQYVGWSVGWLSVFLKNGSLDLPAFYMNL